MAPRKKTETVQDAELNTTNEIGPFETSLQERHLWIGWIGLLVFLTFGIVLESLHGFKISYYLDVRNETRRLLWTLAHSHGALFSLIHIAFAYTLSALSEKNKNSLRFASACFTGSLLAMPLGFFLGGVWLYGGDPGLGILLAPIGGAMLLAGVISVLLSIRSQKK